MSQFIALIPDLILLAIVLFFAWRGASRGLILTLCSMLAVVVALAGALFLTRLLTPIAAPHIEPFFTNAIEAHIESSLTSDPAAEGEGEQAEPDSFLWEALRSSDWYQPVTDAVREGTESAIAAAAKSAGRFLAEAAVRVVLFLLSFFLLLLVWFLVSHALDLAFKLPVLRTFNTAGGMLIGVVKGILLIYILAFALTRFPGILTEERVADTFLLRLLLAYNPLSLIPLIRV